MSKNLIIAITGASGAIYGIRLLGILQTLKINTHLVISKAAHLTINLETDYKIEGIRNLATYNYHPIEIGACIASGSYNQVSGMIIAPCSSKTMSAIACGLEIDLIARAANVMLKERKKLVLMLRETPLHAGHLENMLKLTNYGAIIAPPVPAFYNHPQNLDDIINHSIFRVLDLFDINKGGIKRWDGIKKLS